MTNWDDQIEWDDLIDEIKYGRCVLVVGPDLVSFNDNQTLFQALCQQLEADARLKDHIDTSPQYIFEHEELFQLKPNRNDTALNRFYRDFYQSRTEFDEPFTKIAQIPFHLIISLLPDRRLSTIFTQQGRSHTFDYHPREHTGPEIAEKPATDKPLIYNITGVLEPPESIITFDHLFSYLQNIMGKNGLPLQLAQTLKEAKIFLFLGVRFEKWYMQVLLRMFVPRESINGRVAKYSLHRSRQTDDTSTFIARRLELDFLSVEPLDFLNELYDRCARQNLLLRPQAPVKATIFLSYSHLDNAMADSLTKALTAVGIRVIVDEQSMSAGDKIRQFMQQVRHVDAFLILVSENSLVSPWVSKEIRHSVESGVPIIPAYLDKQFLEPDAAQQGLDFARLRLRQIDRQINERRENNPVDSVGDLTEERDLWSELFQHLPDTLADLKGRKCIPLQRGTTDWEPVVDAILKRH